tara:strand:- start:1342 stop:1563 length:222 start_codon:yes stop_codon:yes gene_type:complete
MSIYSTVENVLVRDYEFIRGLSDGTLDKIVVDVMEELENYDLEACTEQFIYQIAGELLAQYIFRGVNYESNID